MRRYLPREELFLNRTLQRLQNHQITETIGSGARGRVFRAHSQDTASNLALKVIPVENLPGGPIDEDVLLAKRTNAKPPSASFRRPLHRRLPVRRHPHTNPVLGFCLRVRGWP